MSADVSPPVSTAALIKRLLSLLLPHKALLAWTVAAAVASVAIALAIPYLFGQAVAGIEARDESAILQYGLLIIGVGLLSALADSGLALGSGRLGLVVEVELRKKIFEHSVSLDTETFAERPSGDVLSRLLVVSGPIVSFLAYRLPALLSDMFVVVLAVVIMFFIDPVLAVIGLWPIPFVAIAARRYTSTLRPAAVDVQARTADLTVELSESIDGVATSQQLGLKQLRIRRFTDSLGRWLQADRRWIAGNGRYLPFVSTLPEVGAATLLLAGGYRVIAGDLTLATLVTLLGYLTMLYSPLERVAPNLLNSVKAAAATQRSLELLDQKSRIFDAASPKDIPAGAALTTTGIAYAHTNSPLLSDVVLDLKPGEHLIVVGDIGAGKTTLLELLKRNFDPQAGEVRLGGVPLHDIRLRALREHTKYVGQDTAILPVSIADNISYGNPGATRAEVVAVAKMVLADRWIESLADGYDTVPTQMGTEPSRSQAAQIQLARALLTAPKLLMVDGNFQLSSEINVALIARRVTQAFPDLSVILVGEWADLSGFPAQVLLLRGSETRMLAPTGRNLSGPDGGLA